MDRVLERAFNKVHSQVHTVQGQQQQQQQPQAGASGSSAAPQQQQPEERDAIQSILHHWSNKDYFKLIQLPEPTADELGRIVWSCTSGDVSRAYRKLSVLVHPDKVPGDDARAAFEALNQAHRMLKDPSQLEEVLKLAGARARKEKERADAAAAMDSSSRAALAASKNQEAKRLRQEQGRNFHGTILEQAKRRQEEAKRKAEALKRARVAEEPQQNEDNEESSEDDDAARQRQQAAAKKRKKPTFM